MFLSVHVRTLFDQARGVPEAATTKKRDLASRLGNKPGTSAAQSLASTSKPAAAAPPAKKVCGAEKPASAPGAEAKPADVSAVKVKTFAELMAEKRAAAAAAGGALSASAGESNNGNRRGAADTPTNSAPAEPAAAMSVEALEAQAEALMEENITENNEDNASNGDAALPDSSSSSSSFHVGQRVVAQFGGDGGEWFPGTVAARHDADNTYDVAYDDGDAEAQKPAHQLVDAAALGV